MNRIELHCNVLYLAYARFNKGSDCFTLRGNLMSIHTVLYVMCSLALLIYATFAKHKQEKVKECSKEPQSIWALFSC